MKYWIYLLVFCIISPFALHAQWNSIPGINNIVSTNTSQKYLSQLIPDGRGNSIMIWAQWATDNYDIYVQKIDANGNIVWNTAGVAVGTGKGDQTLPCSVSDGNGGVIIAWYDTRPPYYAGAIYSQHIDAGGNVLWAANGIALATAPAGFGVIQYPDIISDSSGGAIVSWWHAEISNKFGAFAQRLDGNGNLLWGATGIKICNTPTWSSNGRFDWSRSSQYSLASDGYHGVFFVWQNADILIQRIDASGQLKFGPDGIVVCNAANKPYYGEVINNEQKAAIVGWGDLRNGTTFNFYCQLVDTSGNLLWTTGGVQIDNTSNNNYANLFTTDGNGGAVFVWQNEIKDIYGVDENDTSYIYAQRVDKNGSIKWGTTPLPICTAPIRESQPDITYDGAGSLLISWTDWRREYGFADVYVQRVDTSGVVACPVNGIPVSIQPNQQGPSHIISNQSGEAIVAWNDARNGTADIYISKVVWTSTTPAVTISASPVSAVCSGETISFTATATGIVNPPTYQWLRNGTDVGTNLQTYSAADFVNGDVISCRLTSNDACALPPVVTSNAITVAVNTSAIPALSIDASSRSICSGISISFTAAPVNGGTSPVFEWQKNGVDVTGANQQTYTASDLLNNDVITCKLTSNNTCASSPVVTSNAITISVNASLMPSVSITASAQNICSGTPVSFTTVTVNGGITPMFEWHKNGLNTGTNTAVYTDNTIADNDVIKCIVHSSESCASIDPAESNSIVMKVNNSAATRVNLGNDRSFCPGGNIELVVTGNYSSYTWQDNSVNSTYNADKPGVYYVTVKDGCGNISSDTIKISNYILPQNFLPKDTALCSFESMIIQPVHSYDQYLWSNGSNAPFIEINNAGNYWLQVTDNNQCSGTDSISVVSKDCINGFFMPTAFSPGSNAGNSSFKPLLYGDLLHYRFSVYNRYGQLVFSTEKLSEGWDGRYKGKPQYTVAFVWFCAYQFKDQSAHNKRGSVLLLR